MKARELWESGANVWGLRDDATMNRIKSISQKNYYRLCEYAPFPLLRRSVEVTFDGTSSFLMPADMIGIHGVTNMDQLRVYKQIDAPKSAPGVLHWGWNYVAQETQHLFEGTCSISYGGKSLTLHDTVEDYEGEWIIFSGQPGSYLIGESNEIARTYYGPTLNYADCIIRPGSQKSILISDGLGEPVDDTVTVWYWAYPPPLYQDIDEIRLPDTRALELMVWLDIIGPIEKRKTEADGYRQELEDSALPELLGRSPQKINPALPRGATGRVIMFGRRR